MKLDSFDHQHEFLEENKYFDKEKDKWVKKCECGLQIEYEEL